jgi:nucleotidyltransferase substrate binding protein (TIGR01987 family)
MGAKLTAKQILLNQMLSTLANAIQLYQKKCTLLDYSKPETVEDLQAYRDSVIQRFEYSIDGFWKILKMYLEDVEGIVLETTGPKSIARIAALNHVISELESADLIIMIEQRNKTSHIYREEIADEIAKNAHKYLSLMQIIFNRLTKKN